MAFVGMAQNDNNCCFMKLVIYSIVLLSLVSCKREAGPYKSADALNKGIIGAFEAQDIDAIQSMFPTKELYREILAMSPELKTPESIDAAMGSYDPYYNRVLEGFEQQFQSEAYQQINWSTAKYEGMEDEEEITRPNAPDLIKLKANAVFNTSTGKYAVPVDAFVYKEKWYLNKIGSPKTL